MITEAAQIAFMGLAAAILVLENKKAKKQENNNKNTSDTPFKEKKGGKKTLMILAGIVIALVLTGWFLLPSLMPRRGPGNGPREFAREGGARSEIPAPSGSGLQQQQL